MTRKTYTEPHFEQIKEWVLNAKINNRQEYLENVLKGISTNIVIKLGHSEDAELVINNEIMNYKKFIPNGETRNITQEEIDDLMFQDFQNPITSSEN